MQPVRASFESRRSTLLFALGAVLVSCGVLGFAFDWVSWIPFSGPGVGLDVDLELLGIVFGVGATLHNRLAPDARVSAPAPEGRHTVYITRPLLTSLLELAERREPESLSIGLAVTPAGRLSGGEDVPESAPVFTHRYLSEHPNSVTSVFGVDLQTPPGRTQGRFVTHPLSGLALTKRDDLHEIVLVAVPPWDDASVAAFDRRGRRHPLQPLDAVPPADPAPPRNQ